MFKIKILRVILRIKPMNLNGYYKEMYMGWMTSMSINLLIVCWIKFVHVNRREV